MTLARQTMNLKNELAEKYTAFNVIEIEYIRAGLVSVFIEATPEQLPQLPEAERATPSMWNADGSIAAYSVFIYGKVA